MIISIVAILFAYLLGSLSAAILLCRVYHLDDPRSTGSKNAGATNVMRVAGKKIAIQVFLLDAAKGFLAVWIAHYFHLPESALASVALAAVIGHIFPVFHCFQGGKGVATTVGVLLALDWRLFLCFGIVWLLLYRLKGYSSLASLTATAILPIAALLFQPSFFLPLFILSLLVLFKHRDNIQRLRAGHETPPTQSL